LRVIHVFEKEKNNLQLDIEEIEYTRNMCKIIFVN